MSTIYTIGFAGKSAREFFTLLMDNGVRRLVDVRLSNNSQLAAFTKKRDLEYFLEAICKIPYLHVPLLAPTKEILDGYKKARITWAQYEERYGKLLVERRKEILRTLSPDLLDGTCLLCSEKEAAQCHRRLAAEFLLRAFEESAPGRFDGIRHL